jgi:hypothetical protein
LSSTRNLARLFAFLGLSHTEGDMAKGSLGPNKTHVISLKLDDEELTKLQDMEGLTGRSRSDIFRRLLRAADIVPETLRFLPPDRVMSLTEREGS